MVTFTALLVFVQVTDIKFVTVCSHINRLFIKFLYSLYKHVGEFVPVHKQADGFKCDSFSIAYGAELMDKKSSMLNNRKATEPFTK